MRTRFLALPLLLALSVSAQTNAASQAESFVQATEAIRANCIQNRRIVCGRILKILPTGLVVESGYTNLLRPPLDRSWLVPGTVNAVRAPDLVEGAEPGCPCVGLVFLTDTPKSRRTKPKPYDYVVIEAYPAGTYTYTSVGTIRRAVRRFCASLEAAVKINRAAAGIRPPSPPSGRAPAYLRMPHLENGALPPLLSQTGAFKDAAMLIPEDGLIPYDLNVPFWSDGAAKQRWMAAPGKIGFRPSGEWTFPKGAVFVKHFELATDETHPDIKHRLETRLLVCDANGGVYGAVYKWRADNSDAELLTTNLTEAIAIKTATGSRTQMWYCPSRQDCLTCHTARAGLVLGVKTRQLNRDYLYPSGVDNELREWNRLGLFEPALQETNIPSYAALAPATDSTRSLEDRARSYLDANCAQCHRPGGTVAYFDARYDTPLKEQNLIEGQILLDEGVDGARRHRAQ